jgi:hypothetical protein
MKTKTINPNANLTGLRAFHGDAKLQKEVIERVLEHKKLDQIRQLATGGGNKWCGIACVFDKYDHAYVARELEIPCSLVYANENIFEGSKGDKAIGNGQVPGVAALAWRILSK